MRSVCMFFAILFLWTALAFSEDGIIYSRQTDRKQTDLYFVTLDGKKTIPISIDPKAHEIFLAYTSDKRVVFAKRARSRDDIYSIRIGAAKATPLAATPDHEQFLRLTSDDKVIYRRLVDGQNDIHIVDADGSNSIVLADGPISETFHAVALDRVVYGIRPGGSGLEKLYSVGLDGKDTRAISHTDWDDYFDLMTRDNRVVFSSYGETKNGDLYIVNPDGMGQRAIANNPNEEFTQNASVLSEDNVLVYGEYAKEGTRLHAVDLSDPELKATALTDAKHRKGFKSFYKNTRVIFDVRVEARNNELRIVSIDGTGEKLLSDGEGVNIFKDIIPDGRIVYEKILKGRQDIYLVNPDSTGRIALANDPDDERYVTISAVSDRIVYHRQDLDEDQWDLYTVRLDGTGRKVIKKTMNREYFVALTLDNRMLFSVIKDGQHDSDLYIVDLDGKNIRPIADTDDDERFVAMTADGRIIYTRVAAWAKEEEKKPPELRRMQGDIYIVDSNGKNRIPLAMSTDPELFMYLIEEPKEVETAPVEESK